MDIEELTDMNGVCLHDNDYLCHYYNSVRDCDDCEYLDSAGGVFKFTLDLNPNSENYSKLKLEMEK